MWHLRVTGEVHTGLWRRNMMTRDHLEDPGVDCRIISERIFKKWDGDCSDSG
jgi:hypothetical protein